MISVRAIFWLVALVAAGCTLSLPTGPVDGSSATLSTEATPSNKLPCVQQAVVAPLQRLTASQYVASARGLLYLSDSQPLDLSLPADEAVGPFAANTQAPVGDLGVLQYQAAAMAVAESALGQLDKLLPCDPKKLNNSCITRFVETFGGRAFRRPLTADERGRYLALANLQSAVDTSSVRLLVQAFLQSPAFLYRIEVGEPNRMPGGGIGLTSFETATRLSFLFWNQAPDDVLLAAAASGDGLNDANARLVQVQRLAKDKRAVTSATEFVKNLVDIAKLKGLIKDSGAYPAYSQDLEAALDQEANDIVAYTLERGDGTFSQLLASPVTVLRGPLAAFYGAESGTAEASNDVVSLNSNQRAGLLTRGAYLAIHAHPRGSGPVPRGRIIRENLLCQKMPAPPVGVSVTPPPPKPGSTTRQLLLAHESNPSCAACHLLMDRIGFGLENYDGIGQWRLTDSGQPVDASGEIISTEASDGAFEGALQLSQRLAASPDVLDCVALQLFRFGMGRQETDADDCAIRGLRNSFRASGGAIMGALGDIASGPTFTQLAASQP